LLLKGRAVDLRFFIKLFVTVVIVVFCSQIGRKLPTLAGLIATAPITSLIVLLWLYSDNVGDFRLMTDYTKGVVWGIMPTVLFFAVAYLCFRRQIGIWLVLAASFSVWLVAAVVHQWLLNR